MGNAADAGQHGRFRFAPSRANRPRALPTDEAVPSCLSHWAECFILRSISLFPRSTPTAGSPVGDRGWLL